MRILYLFFWISIFFVLVSQGRASASVKQGEWQVTITEEIVGLSPKAFELLKQAREERFPAEAVALLEKQVAEDAVMAPQDALTWDGGTTTTARCITSENQATFLPIDGECALQQDREGDSFSFTGTCPNGESVSGHIAYSDSAIAGQISIASKGMTLRKKIAGQYVGPCS